MAMPSAMRTFVAVPISRRTAEALSEIRKAFRTAEAHIRWTPPHQYHITLMFLGDVERSKAPEIVEAVRSAAAHREALTLRFQGVGAFPDWERPRVLWSRVTEGAGELVELSRAVRSALAAVVAGEGGAPFRPHVTLGRTKSQTPPDGLYRLASACSGMRAGPELIDRVVVYESRLTPRGAVYTEIESIPLRPAAGRVEESRNV